MAGTFPGFGAGGLTGGSSGPALAEGGSTGDFVFGANRPVTDFSRMAGIAAVGLGFIALVFVLKK